MLRDHDWKPRYTSDDGNLARLLHVPALRDAVRYDRLTGFFNAAALTLAARGIEDLARNGGKMRLVVGCTLEPDEIKAIQNGEALREQVERRMAGAPLAPPDDVAADARELLAWMVKHRLLDVKVAVPCDEGGAPVSDNSLFHVKIGVIEDKSGDKLAWDGSVNETEAGLRRNWESVNVFASWDDPKRVELDEAEFNRVWTGKAKRLIVMDVPEAVRRELLKHAPRSGKPKRLREDDDLRNRVWAFLRDAPKQPGGGERIGEATAAVDPWPHQARALARLYQNWPPRLLIADEVGLGKTIEAGLLLRQAWLAGKARRVLILAPKAVLGQWQVELREKFNLDWPIYDAGKLRWYPTLASGRREREVGRDAWRKEPFVIASSQLMRRKDRMDELLRSDARWDLIVLDEAHHARKSPGGSANHLLRLMRGLKDRAPGLLLLTATPMQVHPVEVWCLLDLLGLPPEWSEEAFLRFFEDVEAEAPSRDARDRMAALFQATEKACGPVVEEESLSGRAALRALRDPASIPRRNLEGETLRTALRILRAGSPARRLISRNTRELLRRYRKKGVMDLPVAERDVADRWLGMSDGERALYEDVKDYIRTTFNRAESGQRRAVGFVMTVYARRLASSLEALRRTLERRLQGEFKAVEDDVPDDETRDDATQDVLDAEETGRLAREAFAVEERTGIEELLAAIRELPTDSKLQSLRAELADLRKAGYEQVMVFTQYADTMDFLRRMLIGETGGALMCYSGRGGEIPEASGGWRVIRREEARRRFQEGGADILLCTDAAAEGLNFQFCGAVVNYDMPWNPMRVEQRIGRIDRLGQRHPTIRIRNLFYRESVETNVYATLRNSHGLFQKVVGRLQPILAKLPGRIQKELLEGETAVVEDEPEGPGFDLDRIAEADLVMPERPAPTATMADLERILAAAERLMPPGYEVERLPPHGYKLRKPGGEWARVTTDVGFFEEHSDSVELWSPGNPLFPEPAIPEGLEPERRRTLREILDEAG